MDDAAISDSHAPGRLPCSRPHLLPPAVRAASLLNFLLSLTGGRVTRNAGLTQGNALPVQQFRHARALPVPCDSRCSLTGTGCRIWPACLLHHGHDWRHISRILPHPPGR